MYAFSCAAPDDFGRIRDFYWALIDVMEGGRFDPGWRKGVYPSDSQLMQSLDRGEMYTLEDENHAIAATVIINNEYNPGYEGLPWKTDAPPERVFMLHTLGVDPARQGRGLARRVVAESLDVARGKGAACVRLDVLDGNEPAMALYRGMGFEYIDSRKMSYEDTGWKVFHMFEYGL